MSEKIFLICQCDMLVGCFAKGQTNSFCDECEDGKIFKCSVELGNANNDRKELFADNCEYCEVIVTSDPEELPAFLST